MKRSEIISQYADEIKAAMADSYRSVLDCNGKVQYRIYVWDDGEIRTLEGVQGDNGYLVAGDAADRKLYFVCTVSEPFFDPWDSTDHAAPDDEEQREAERQEIIAWCMEAYEANMNDIVAQIINDAKEEESMQQRS